MKTKLKLIIGILGILLLASVVFAGVIISGERTTTKDTTHIKEYFGNDIGLGDSRDFNDTHIRTCLNMSGFIKECSEYFSKDKLSNSEINDLMTLENDKLIEKANNELGNLSVQLQSNTEQTEDIKVNH